MATNIFLSPATGVQILHCFCVISEFERGNLKFCTHEACLPRVDLSWPAGLRQACSTFGALLGATVAGLAFKISAQNYTITFALSTIPALAALLLTISVSFQLSIL